MNTENNKIIAEFMGWELKHNPNISQKTWNNKEKGYCKDKESTFIEYSNDWNWLMEVVDKINNGRIYTESKEYRNFCLLKITDSIEQVYFTCLEFIKWYNLNK